MRANTTTKETTLPNPSQYIKALERTNPMLNELDRGTSHSQALARTALKLVAHKESKGVESNDIGLYGLRLIGHLPDYMAANKRLGVIEKQNDGRRFSQQEREDRIEAKQSIIAFNEVVRDMINYHPNLRLSSIVEYVSSAAIHMPEEAAGSNIGKSVRGIIDGMRHEIAFEGALYFIDGVEDVYQATAEEDRKGVDLIVKYKGSWLPIDVKASGFQAQKAAQQRRHMHSNDISAPVWSGLEWEDFGDSLRVTDQERTRQQAKYIEEQLELIHQGGCKNYVDML